VAEGATVRLVPPDAVLRIVAKLEKAGHEAWCVGGAVRDALLGQHHLDWDIATSARPEQVQRVFPRTIPVGIQFGTVGVLDRAGTLHEVTTFRRDVRTDGRHAEVEFGASLDDDLARRDFTINAIAYSPSRNEVRDPFGGRRDLEQRIVRAVGDASARMREDRLRALRGIRFAARFGFVLEPATWRAIVDSAPHMRRLSAERVKQEIEKTIDQVARPGAAFTRWRDSGAFTTLVPALADATEGDFAVIDQVARPKNTRRSLRHLLRIVALFLPVPGTEVRRVLRDLRFSNVEVNNVARIIDAWHRLGGDVGAALADGVPNDATIRRWVAATGRTQWTLFVRLADAVWRNARGSGIPAPAPSRIGAVYRRGVRIAYRDPIDIADLAVDGDDLRSAGVPAGPAIGKALAQLLARVIEDPSLNQRDALLRVARDIS
jgi:tRNA nucleotidyltransferase (CCA-adding enzyme)